MSFKSVAGVVPEDYGLDISRRNASFAKLLSDALSRACRIDVIQHKFVDPRSV